MGTDVDCLIDGTTYSFTNLLARTFQGKKQLSAPKHVAIEKQVDDGSTDVVSAESFDSVFDSPRTIKHAEVTAVLVFALYTACLTHKAKAETNLQKVVYCTCAMPQRLDKCIKQVSARVIVQADIYSIEDPTSLLPLLAAI